MPEPHRSSPSPSLPSRFAPCSCSQRHRLSSEELSSLVHTALSIHPASCSPCCTRACLWFTRSTAATGVPLGIIAQACSFPTPSFICKMKVSHQPFVHLVQPLLSARPRFRLARPCLFRRPFSTSPEGSAVSFSLNRGYMCKTWGLFSVKSEDP